MVRNSWRDADARTRVEQDAAFDTIDPMLPEDIYLDGRLPPPDASFVTGRISLSTLIAHRSGVQLVTVSREPRSRQLSHWLFWRGLTDSQLRPWGEWAGFVRVAHKPLAAFLSDRNVACNTDNLAVRMLLWPLSDIPDSDFIHRRDDRQLVNAAIARLETFAFADILENPRLLANLRNWLGRAFNYGRMNETARLPQALRSRLAEEFTENAFDLLDARTRLGREVWLALARDQVGHKGAAMLAERAIIRNIARHSTLMEN